MGEVDHHFLSLLNISILEGKNFEEGIDNKRVLVSKSFTEKIVNFTNWEDGVVGKDLLFSSYGHVTIHGVFSDIRLSSIQEEDTRPAVLLYRKSAENPIVLAKFINLNIENLNIFNQKLSQLLLSETPYAKSYKLEMQSLYESSRLFRSAVIVGGLMTLIITLIGLISYVKNDMRRRRYEIAIRRVHGSSVTEILILFSKEFY